MENVILKVLQGWGHRSKYDLIHNRDRGQTNSLLCSNIRNDVARNFINLQSLPI